MPLNSFDSLCSKNQRIIVSKDKGSPCKHIAYNTHLAYVTHYMVDGYVLTEGMRCDFLLINEDTKIGYLIELKGSDLVRASRQLEETEKALKQQLTQYQIMYRIIIRKSSTHAIHSSAFRSFQVRKGKKLIYHNNEYKENI